MSNRNNSSRQRGRNCSDPTSSRRDTKYHRRGDNRNYRPESNHHPITGDDVNSLTASISRHLTTDGNPSQKSFSTEHSVKHNRDHRPSKETYSPYNSQKGWWRITVPQAGTIGKQRVMEALQARCNRPFHPYHYYIETRNKDGVFFLNNQDDADMLKRLNGKVEVQNLDILRILISRIPAPVPAIDEDARPHLKDHLFTHRFDQLTYKLDLTNLADDEELSSLGIFPQTNKQAFMRDIIDIINKDLNMTRVLDLGSNNIMSLYEFRNLHLNNLVQISFASNRLKNIDDFDHLKQLPHLAHIYIKNNPLTLQNTKQTNSMNDTISTIQKKLPQLRRIDDVELPTIIRFGTDIEIATLPKSIPHCVPAGEIETFLKKFIDIFYVLFDKPGREELQILYHDQCLFSLCITPIDNSHVPIRQYKYGSLIYESRNLKKLTDDNRRINLLRHGKKAVMDFFRGTFPLTEHHGDSLRVDVISTINHRVTFTINGLYKEGQFQDDRGNLHSDDVILVDQTTNNPVRCFQRTFTCVSAGTDILIIADHILLTNATDAQVSKMNRPSPVLPQTTNNTNTNLESQMTLQFSQQSGMNIEYSKLCLQQNNWDYNKAAGAFLEAQKNNLIPPAAFNTS